MMVHAERFALRIALIAADFAERLTVLLRRFAGRRGSNGAKGTAA
jgi:hypothetical protein